MAITINSTNGNIAAGGDGSDGDLILRDNAGLDRIRLDAGGGNGWFGGHGADGDLVLFASGGDNASTDKATIHMDGGGGNIFAGGQGIDGDLVLRSGEGQDRIRLDAGGGNGWFGGNGTDGDLVLFASGGDNATTDKATIHMDGGAGNIFAGGQGTDGDLVLRDGAGQDRIRLDAGGANMWIGGNGADGDIVVFAAGGDNTTLADATIHLNGDAGDIILQNADCAEDFEVAEAAEAEPGSVMVIGGDGRLSQCSMPYDRCVAGIVAGAATLRPGIVLGRKATARRALPIALIGRVFCKVDADQGAIAVGDLLTTSPTPGHAMKADDPLQAFGAVIGKALEPLAAGRGLLPVLVALQ